MRRVEKGAVDRHEQTCARIRGRGIRVPKERQRAPYLVQKDRFNDIGKSCTSNEHRKAKRVEGVEKRVERGSYAHPSVIVKDVVEERLRKSLRTSCSRS